MSTLYTAPFLLLGLANFSIVASFACFYMFPLFVLDRGGSQADVGVIMGSFSLASVLCRPWISDMVDRVGRKRCLTLGTLIMSLVPLGYAWFRGSLHEIYGLVLLVRIVHGVGLAICSTAMFTYVTDIIPAHRLIEGIGIFGVSGLVGLAFGPVIAEMVIREWGFTTFFLTASLLGTIAVVCHQWLTDAYVAQERFPAPSFFQLLRRGKLLLVASLAALFGISVAATGSFVTPFAREQHLHFIAFYYIAYSTAAVLTRVGGARLADRVGERRVLPYALLLGSAGLLLLALLGGPMILVLAGLLSGCGHGFLFPSLNALAVRDEPAQNRGKVTGIFTGSIDAGVFAGSILLGYVGDWMGFRTLFVTAGLAMLAGLAFRPWRAAGESPPDEVARGRA
jgi:MFS family permease